MDSPITLTTHNPFGDDDPGGQSGYALVTSIFSKVKNTFAVNGPSGTSGGSNVLTTPVAPSASESTNKPTNKPISKVATPANPPSPSRAPSLKPATKSLKPGGSNPAPPLVSFAPIAVEQPRYVAEGAYVSPQTYDGVERMYGTSIPGFAIPDDARSVRTVASTRRGASISKVIRRIRGEGLSRDYWMDDEHCKECYDCKSIFTTWRRKHHCRVCGQIYCSRCAANIISSSRFGQEGMIRVCNICLQVLEDEGLDDDDDRRSVTSAATSAPVYHPYHHHQHSLSLSQSYQPPSPFSTTGARRTDEPFPHFSRDSLIRHRLQYQTHDSDDSRPQTPTEGFFNPEPVPAPAPFRRAPNEDQLEVGEEDMEEKEIELYYEGAGRSNGGTRRNVGVGEGKGGKAFVFSNRPTSPGALQLETGAAIMHQMATVMSNAATPTPGLAESNQAATDTPTPNTESSILFPASASSPETPAGLVPIPALGMRRDSSAALGRERPRLGSGDRLRLNSFGNRLDSFTGGRMDSYGRMDSFNGSHAGDRTPYLRSRVHSRLGEFSPLSAEGETGWRTRRESSAYAAELNAVSMFHLRIMIRQLLSRAQIGRSREGAPATGGLNFEETNGHSNEKDEIPSVPEKSIAVEWEDTLLRLSLKLASRLNVASTSSGNNADMDVRHFVKIKKIPGGRPRDSEYVDGAVISSNLAHKKMKRNLHSPRIMILAFSLEWQRRENEYLTLDSILAQEREYLRNLVARITALRPHLVLVERTVSRLALEFLMAANVAVARAVPPRSTKFVARMTGAEVVPDIPALHRGPRLGESSRFKVQTYDHHLIPGRRKTFMRFEGCDPHRSGCTIILRGADLDTLKKLKEVMRFIAFIVRNLKMESFLWKDCVVTMPGVTGEAIPVPLANGANSVVAGPSDVSGAMRPRAKSFPGLGARMINESTPESGPGLNRWVSPVLPDPSPVFEDDDYLSADDDAEDEAVALSRRINASLRPYLTTFISASATLRFQPPWPVRRMKEADDQLRAVKREWEERYSKKVPTKVLTMTEEEGPGLDKESEVELDKESTPSVIVVDPSDEPSDHKIHPSASLSSLRSAISASLVALPAVPSHIHTPAPSPLASGLAAPAPELHSPSELDVESRLADAKECHETRRREWEWYLRRNRDDLAVEKYQQIALRSFIIPTASGSSSVTGSAAPGQMENPYRPCFRPELKYISYYGDNDRSLARFVEETCSIPVNVVCEAKGCNILQIAHTQVFVHNESQVLISTEPWTGRIGANKFAAPLYEGITTWSICQVCTQNTPLIPLSEEAGRYSFAKFLELHFYPADVLLMHGAGCSHNIYKDHVRYFHWHGMTVRFQTEKVTVHELVFPPTTIRVRPQALLSFKNKDYTELLQRNAAYWESVLSRIQTAIEAAIQLAQTHPEQAQKVSTLAADMRERSLYQRNFVEQLIHREYANSPITDTLQLGRVRPIWQRIITQFDDEFGQLERLYLPSGYYVGTEKDFRRSVAPNKISKFVPEIMGSMFNTVDRKVISRFVDSEKRQTGPKRDSTRLASSASEYESNVDSCAEPPNPGTVARPSSIDLPSPAEASGRELHQPPSGASGILVEPLLIDGHLVGVQTIDSQCEGSDGGDSDSTIPASRTHPSTALDPREVQQEAGSGSRDLTPAPAPSRPALDVNGPGNTTEQPITNAAQTESPAQERNDTVGEMTTLPSEELFQRISRLPRRVRPHPNVSDLVKQFQAVLPEDFATGAVGYGPLARTSLLSDSEHDSEAQPRWVRGRSRVTANRPKFQPKPRTMGSDFERSYAVNVVPRQTRDSASEIGPSRIPAPIQPIISPPAEATQSGRSSPAHSMLNIPKRPMISRTTTGSTIKNVNAAALEPLTGTRKTSPNFNKSAKGKAPARNLPRDRSSLRNASSTTSNKQSTRRGTGPGLSNTASKVATQIRQFERISKENEKANRRYAIIRGRRARPVVTAKPKVEIFANYKDALRDDESESSDSSSEADDEDEGEEDPSKLRVDTLDPILSVSDLTAHSMTLSVPASSIPAPDQQTSNKNEHEKHKERTELKLQAHARHVADFTPESSVPSSPLIRPRDSVLGQGNYSEAELSASADQRSFLYRMSYAAISRMQSREYTAMNLSYPAAPTDHVFAESYITVREDEPTSIIALTLSAHDYQINMSKNLGLKDNKPIEKPEAFMPDDLSVGETPSTWGFISHDDLPDPADVLKHPKSVSHQTYSYQSGDVTVTCKVLYAEQFQALRRSCGCDQIMIQSLARCIKWDASGGKSGSVFLKTRDERFIAKGLSKREAEDMGKFAPQYFDYMSSALSDGRPSILTKLFGFYQISLKNPMAGKSVKMNLLVMENLWYDRKFAHVYDLKGLTRGRNVQKTGRENEVLLDENLVQASHAGPYYLREHAKRILRTAISNDTEFLAHANVNVMDYSMVVGVDNVKNELVIGIVDFIRTYSWDKRVENLLKEKVLGQGEGPTIVTPKLYKERFRTAMEQYFPLLPDRWMKVRDSPETQENDKSTQRP